RHHQQAEPRPQTAGHATLPAAVERPLDFPRAVLRFLDAIRPHFEQRAQRVALSLLVLDDRDVPPLENTPQRELGVHLPHILDGLAEVREGLKREGGALERDHELMGGGAAVGVQRPGHASSDLGSRERTYCAGALPPEQAAWEPNAKRAGKYHAHYTRCQSRATSRRGRRRPRQPRGSVPSLAAYRCVAFRPELGH